MILKVLIFLAIVFIVFHTGIIMLLPGLIFAFLIATILLFLFLPVLKPLFPLQWRRDLYTPRLRPMSEGEFEKIRERMHRQGSRFTPVKVPELSPGFRKGSMNLQPELVPEQARSEQEFVNAVNLVMAPHKPAEGVYCQEGTDRIYFITQREVTKNPFFRENQEV